MTRMNRRQRSDQSESADSERPVSRDVVPSPLAQLLPALRRLDEALAIAVAEAEQRFGDAARGDLFRGLHITPDDVTRLFARAPCELLFGVTAHAHLMESGSWCDDSPLGRLGREYGLDAFELAAVLIALAPELDLRYERLFAYLQDDVTLRRPSVDLVLSLVCATADEKVTRRSYFGADATLLREGIVELIVETPLRQGLSGKCIRLGEQFVRALTGGDALDSRLAAFCHTVDPNAGHLAEPDATQGAEHDAATGVSSDPSTELTRLARHAAESARPLCVALTGRARLALRGAARAMAAACGKRLLIADLGIAPLSDERSEWESVLVREARLRDLLLYIEDVRPNADPRPMPARVLQRLGRHRGIVVLASDRTWERNEQGLPGMVSYTLDVPTAHERLALWQHELSQHGQLADADDLREIAERFRLLPHEIADAAADAVVRAAAQHPGMDGSRRAMRVADVHAAARQHSGHRLAELAERIVPSATLEDIVLEADASAQLRELRDRVRYSHRVLGEWGFGKKLRRGRGTAALFSGGSGTGKTMAAEAVAQALGLDLHRVDLARVVSKYIGETEKNLARIFSAAEDANTVLLFDEADALFGKRSEVHDAHDRYANIEISYLLQRIEAHDGVTIMATNLADNLDTAFARRLAFHVYFPFPDEAARGELWRRAWPVAAPVSPSINSAALARDLKISGGSIKNIALAASFFAAADRGQIEWHHVVRAVRREQQKSGGSFSISASYDESAARGPVA